MIDKRKKTTMTEQEMYKISNINEFIEKEQRKDELDRLYEVKEQKKVWYSIVLASLALNVTLAVFAIMGYLKNV